MAALYRGEAGKQRWPRAVQNGFLDVMGLIEAMPDQRDLYGMKSLHFEQLSGKRQGQCSLRLNKQYRLIVTVEHEDGGDVLVVHEIEDYHR